MSLTRLIGTALLVSTLACGAATTKAPSFQVPPHHQIPPAHSAVPTASAAQSAQLVASASPQSSTQRLELTGARLFGSGPTRLAQARGKVVLVEPFGTWCGYCRDSLKLAQQVAQESGGAVVVIGVATEYSDQASDDKLRAYLKELGVSFAVVREPDAADRLELDSMPATLVVDRQGVVRARFLGAADSGKLRAWVRALLGEDAS